MNNVPTSVMELCDNLLKHAIQWTHEAPWMKPYVDYNLAWPYIEKCFATLAPQPAEAPFQVGQPVTKPKGYRFNGVVKAIWWEDEANDWRLVVKSGDGLMHIFSPSQLAPATAKQEEATSSLLIDNGTKLVGDSTDALLDTLAGALLAFRQHEASSFHGPDGDKSRRNSWRGVIRKVNAALSRFKAYKEGCEMNMHDIMNWIWIVFAFILLACHGPETATWGCLVIANIWQATKPKEKAKS